MKLVLQCRFLSTKYDSNLNYRNISNHKTFRHHLFCIIILFISELYTYVTKHLTYLRGEFHHITYLSYYNSFEVVKDLNDISLLYDSWSILICFATIFPLSYIIRWIIRSLWFKVKNGGCFTLISVTNLFTTTFIR